MGQVRARGIPVVGVANGYVFAGNAALLGMCDVVVATRGGNSKLAGGGKGTMGKTSIGMGGKAMIEAGGLGVVESDDIGPTNVHAETGGVDIVVEHEDSAALMVRKVLSYFTQPRLHERQWTYSHNVQLLRTCLPSVKTKSLRHAPCHLSPCRRWQFRRASPTLRYRHDHRFGTHQRSSSSHPRQRPNPHPSVERSTSTQRSKPPAYSNFSPALGQHTSSASATPPVSWSDLNSNAPQQQVDPSAPLASGSPPSPNLHSREGALQG